MSSFLPEKGINNLYHFTFQSKTHFWLISTLQYIIYSTYIGKVGYFWRAYEGVEHKPLDFITLVCIPVSYFHQFLVLAIEPRSRLHVPQLWQSMIFKQGSP